MITALLRREKKTSQLRCNEMHAAQDKARSLYEPRVGFNVVNPCIWSRFRR